MPVHGRKAGKKGILILMLNLIYNVYHPKNGKK